MIHRRLIVAGLAGVAWLGIAVPAQAADEAKVSWDGTSWADHIEGQLFAQPDYWVPGDEAIGSFHVLNNSSDPASVSVEVLDDNVLSLLNLASFTLAVSFDGEEWRDLEPAGRFTLGVIPAQTSSRVFVRGTFHPGADNDSQTRTANRGVRITLEGKPGLTPQSRSGEPSTLAFTGGNILVLLLVAAVLVGSGLALVRGTSRRREVGTDAS